MVAFIGKSPVITGGVNSDRVKDEQAVKVRKEHYEYCEKYIKVYNAQTVHTQEEVNRYLNCPQAVSNEIPVGWIFIAPFLILVICASAVIERS